jgi:hypothetical protein
MLVGLLGRWQDPATYEFTYHLRTALRQNVADPPRVHHGVYLARINLNYEICHLIKNDRPERCLDYVKGVATLAKISAAYRDVEKEPSWKPL